MANSPRPPTTRVKSFTHAAMEMDLGGSADFIEKIVALLVKPFEEAAESAKFIADETERQLAATREVIALRRTDLQNLVELRRQQAEDKHTSDATQALGASKVTRVAGVGMGMTASWQEARGLTDEERKDQSVLKSQMQNRGIEIQRLENALDAQIDAVRAELSDGEKIAQVQKRLQDLVGAGTRPFTQAEADASLAKFKESLTAKAQREKARAEQEKLRQEHEAELAKKAAAAEAEAQRKQEAADAEARRKKEAADTQAEQLKQDTDAMKAAIKSAKAEVAAFDQDIAVSDKDPRLTDQQKYQKRVQLLNDQAVAIARVTDALHNYKPAQGQLDKGNRDAIDATVDGFDDKKKKAAVDRQPPASLAQNHAKAVSDLTDPAKHYQSAGDGILGSLQQQAAKIGTFGDQIAGVFTTVGDKIRTSLGAAFADAILKGGTFRRAMTNIGQAVLASFVQSGAQMVADWLWQHTVMAGIKKWFTAQDIATTSAAEGAKNAVVMGGAAARVGAVSAEQGTSTGIVVAAAGQQSAATGIAGVFQSIMQLGPIAGPIVMAAALAGMIALVSSLVPREMGGPVTAGQAYLVGEKRPEIFVPGGNGFIIPSVAQAMTQPAYQPPAATSGGRSRNRSGGAGAGGDSAAGGGASQRPVNVYPLMADDRGSIERAQRDPYSDAHFVHMLKKHRRVIGVKG